MVDTAPAASDDLATNEVQSDAMRAIADALAAKGQEHLSDPEDDEGGDDGVKFRTNGWLVFYDGDQRYRLRRPRLGALEDLELALESVSDEIESERTKVLTKMNGFRDQVKTVEQSTDMDARQAKRKVRDLRGKIEREDSKFARTQRGLLLKWWGQAFEKLSEDGTPEDWPADVTDASLPSKAMDHWRQVPLGRGAAK